MAEPSNWIYLVPTFIAILVLMGLYAFGVWLRSFVFPTGNGLPLKRQLLASIPVGLITMAGYAKTALPSVNFSDPSTAAFDLCLIAGYTMVFGMLSREALEGLFSGRPPVPTLPRLNP